MLNGKTLVELAQAVQTAAAHKVDVVADTRNIRYTLDGEKDVIEVRGKSGTVDYVADANDHTFSQIIEHNKIPATYAERMRKENPALLINNINSWFQTKPALRLVRMTNGGEPKARAFLSNRFQRRDHDQMLAAVLPQLIEHTQGRQIEIVSTELTEKKMYLKVIMPGRTGEVKKGDIVRYGFTLSNSEIGLGRWNFLPFCDRLACLNGMVLPASIDDTRLSKTHVGGALEEGTIDFDDDTVKADDVAMALKLRDTLKAFLDPARWAAVLARMQDAARSEEAKDQIVTVERLADTFALPKPEQNDILKAFLTGNDFTRWGLANAVTNIANHSQSYDRACELEQLGGRVLALPDSDWSRLAKAA